MKKFKVIILVTGLFLFGSLTGQSNGTQKNDIERISLAVFMPANNQGMTPSARNALIKKMNQIATNNGFGDDVFTKRFILTSKVNILTQNLTPTAPPMHAYTLNVTFYIGDAVTGTKFSNFSKTIKGIGTSEANAFNQALRNIKTSDVAFRNFINTGKQKITKAYSNIGVDNIKNQSQKETYNYNAISRW